jgi:pimeloyl-ACP methyl ester carboxylesterase
METAAATSAAYGKGARKMAYFRSFLVGTLALLLAGCGSDDAATGTQSTPTGTPDKETLPLDVALPIVFVHGFAGSAQQYESQAIRFAANGYPRERIFALDHDGAGTDYATYVSLVDALVDQVRAKFSVDKVYLVGHSRGTLVSTNYLGDATRAAKIAKYVSLDGGGCGAADTANIPCISLVQAARGGTHEMPLSGQAHVECATSLESFVEQYKLFVGAEPEVTEIVPQDKPVELTGRLVIFPANIGRAGTTLEIWEINPDTGHRLGGAPIKTYSIDETGDWGPIVVSPDKRYEMAVVAPDSGSHHFYLQRYVRSSHLVRLLSGQPDSPIRNATHRGPNHAAVIAMRMREWYTDPSPTAAGGPLGGQARDPAKMDLLEVGTTSSGRDQAPANIIQTRMTNGDIAIHIHDDEASPGESTFGALPAFSDPACTNCTAFQTTADVFMPASDPPDGTITFKNIPRGDSAKPQVVKVPNWASENHLISIIFSDYPQ